MINLPYSKELAGFIRYIVEYPNTINYSEYKRSLIGKTVKGEKFHIIDNMLIYNRLLIAKRSNIGIIHIIVCEDSDMFI